MNAPGLECPMRWFKLDARDQFRICFGIVWLGVVVLFRRGGEWLPVYNPVVILSLIVVCIFAGLLVHREWLDSTEPEASGRSPYNASTEHNRDEQPTRRTSRVETRKLSVVVDLDWGPMDGTVLAGRFRGRALSTLDIDDLLALHAEFRTEPYQTLALVEAYLDRRCPGWPAEAQQTFGRHEEREQEHVPAPRSAMGRREAFATLELQDGASAAEIKAAYRRLIKVAHPDHGGSADRAARLNAAKDLLLG